MLFVESYTFVISGVSRVGLKGVSERRKCKWLVRIGTSNGVTHLINKIMAGGGGAVSWQPEKTPGYATGYSDDVFMLTA